MQECMHMYVVAYLVGGQAQHAADAESQQVVTAVDEACHQHRQAQALQPQPRPPLRQRSPHQ